MKKAKNTSKENIMESTIEKKLRKGKKLTAQERRQIERAQRAKRNENDPLAAFDTDPTFDYNNSFGFGGLPIVEEQDQIQKKPKDKPKPKPKKKPGFMFDDIDDDDDDLFDTKISDLTPKQRKIRRYLSYGAVFVLITGIALILSLTVLFRTTEIRIETSHLPYTNEEIIETSGLSFSDNIFLAKRKAAEKKLIETYPYVEDVEVTFKIPGTQIIRITAAIPSYQVQFSGGFAVLSGNGRILEVNEGQRAEVPLLKGFKLYQTTPGEYITFENTTTKTILDDVVQNINENEMPSIYGIDISNSANIELNYDNRITIILGLPEDVGYKLRTAKAIITQELAATDKGTLDVSLSNSDRHSSYFTPIYSDTVSAPKQTESSQASESETGSKIVSSGDESSNETDNEIEEYEEEQGDNEYLDDIID
ncbi:MAG: FtsQ-type POTRA domain-containing protein [Clostridia bacterium]|nr:FtsQ-type POTRA domain-containing protein [Clostridia bacterium]